VQGNQGEVCQGLRVLCVCSTSLGCVPARLPSSLCLHCGVPRCSCLLCACVAKCLLSFLPLVSAREPRSTADVCIAFRKGEPEQRLLEPQL